MTSTPSGFHLIYDGRRVCILSVHSVIIYADDQFQWVAIIELATNQRELEFTALFGSHSFVFGTRQEKNSRSRARRKKSVKS